MVFFLAAVFVVAGVLFYGVRVAFMSIAALNGRRFGVCILGIGQYLHTFMVLASGVAWLDNFRPAQTLGCTGPTRRRRARWDAMLG